MSKWLILESHTQLERGTIRLHLREVLHLLNLPVQEQAYHEQAAHLKNQGAQDGLKISKHKSDTHQEYTHCAQHDS